MTNAGLGDCAVTRRRGTPGTVLSFYLAPVARALASLRCTSFCTVAIPGRGWRVPGAPPRSGPAYSLFCGRRGGRQWAAKKLQGHVRDRPVDDRHEAIARRGHATYLSAHAGVTGPVDACVGAHVSMASRGGDHACLWSPRRRRIPHDGYTGTSASHSTRTVP